MKRVFPPIILTPLLLLALLCRWIAPSSVVAADALPLSEHPRPDFQRAEWLNLNGPWQFRFDEGNAGLKEKWFQGKTAFPETIVVPFPWGAPLSQVSDKASLAWYARTVQVPAGWKSKRVFLVIG